MDCFKKEILLVLNYNELDAGYSHIKYYIKNNITFVLSKITNNILLCDNEKTRVLSESDFFKKIKDYEI